MSVWKCPNCEREYVEEPDEEILAEWVCLNSIDNDSFVGGTCMGIMHKVTAIDGEVAQ